MLFSFIAKMKKYSYFVFLAVFLSAGCKVRQIVKKEVSPKIRASLTQSVATDTAAYSKINQDSLDARLLWHRIRNIPDRINFTTLSAKIQATYASNAGETYNLNISLRLLKDSIIWLSFNAMGLFEPFRVYITPSEIKIMDRLSGTAQIRSLAYLRHLLGFPIDFTLLQKMILGEAVGLQDSVEQVKKEPANLWVQTRNRHYEAHLAYALQDTLLQSNRLVFGQTPLGEMRVFMNYDKYDTTVLPQGFAFALFRKVSIENTKSFQITLSFKDVKCNQALNYPFSIPARFKIFTDFSK